MHEYEMKIIAFMETVAKQSLPVEDALLKPATKDIEHYLRKLYEEDPNRPFTLRMSSVGRPLCQSKMHKACAASVNDDWFLPLRFMYGGIIEGLAMSVLRHAGINIEEEQTAVYLDVNVPSELDASGFVSISGTLDLVIDGKVWDIKSASPIAFKDKFESYESLKEDDTFGYLCQLYGYAAARGLPPGGFIVVDKSSGEIKVVPVPDDYTSEMERALGTIQYNTIALLGNEEFARCFTDNDETFRKRYTGNKVLTSPCIWCKYRYSCWPGLIHAASVLSTAYDKPYKYYTKLENKGSIDG